MSGPRPDWQLRPHGTAAAARRHHRHGTPLCEPCRQHEKRRRAAEYALTAVYAAHADAGNGTARCATPGARKVAAPGEPVTCKRCRLIRGTS
ncbi:MAG: hypothetical protein ACRDVE_15330 [Actinocrinis sp.]